MWQQNVLVYMCYISDYMSYRVLWKLVTCRHKPVNRVVQCVHCVTCLFTADHDMYVEMFLACRNSGMELLSRLHTGVVRKLIALYTATKHGIPLPPIRSAFAFSYVLGSLAKNAFQLSPWKHRYIVIAYKQIRQTKRKRLVFFTFISQGDLCLQLVSISFVCLLLFNWPRTSWSELF